ncbi:hypothetical protein [Microbacterium immunditiarum]|uniref:Preprotein translocase subunit SecG n=1 Tax=Microbacterium immunditiarum TaxID=337480 RepID=A0A7Y9GKB3_9MICO|nr:hypothetical protein [Microbacterium immunditiarum]NYE18048.1 preprotein translocase subunit SecG [Microbacterium immunditiarum]
MTREIMIAVLIAVSAAGGIGLIVGMPVVAMSAARGNGRMLRRSVLVVVLLFALGVAASVVLGAVTGDMFS